MILPLFFISKVCFHTSVVLQLTSMTCGALLTGEKDIIQEHLRTGHTQVRSNTWVSFGSTAGAGQCCCEATVIMEKSWQLEELPYNWIWQMLLQSERAARSIQGTTGQAALSQSTRRLRSKSSKAFQAI